MGLKVCNVTHVRCPELTDHPSGKCETHRLEAKRVSDAGRPSARARGYDAQHEADRDAYLHAHPICEDPEGCDQPSTVLDHVDGLGPNGPRGHDPSNWRALCATHHNRRTARDQPGGWHST